MKYFVVFLITALFCGNVFAEDIINFNQNTPVDVEVSYGSDYYELNEEILRLNVNFVTPSQELTNMTILFDVQHGTCPWDAIDLIYQDIVLASEMGYEANGYWQFDFFDINLTLNSPLQNDFFFISFLAKNIVLDMSTYYVEITIPFIEVVDAEDGTLFTEDEIITTGLSLNETHVDFVSFVSGCRPNNDAYYWLLPGENIGTSFYTYPWEAAQLVTMDYYNALWPFEYWTQSLYVAPDTMLLANHGSLMVNNTGNEIHISWISDNTLYSGFSLGGLTVWNNDSPVGTTVTIPSYVDMGLIDNYGNITTAYKNNSKTIRTIDRILGDVDGDQIVEYEDALWIQDILTNQRQANWNKYTETGINLGGGGILYSWATLLDAYLIMVWLQDPDHPLVQGLGIGEWMSGVVNTAVQPEPYEVELNDQLTVWTDGDAVAVSAILSDGSYWQQSAWTANGQVIFTDIPQWVSEENISVEAVSIAGFTSEASLPVIEPTQFTLNQNYPNPFNPTTTIEFTLPTAGDVQLNIYNLAGQQVARLANGHYTAGIHTVDFNGNDFPSGTYFYSLQANGQQETRKMLLVK